MKTSIAEIKFQMRKRGDNLEKSPIGSKLKFKRKQLNLTLEEGSQDICSVSYLSKVENNLIKPTDKYIDMLKQKYQMTSDEFNEDLYDTDLDMMILSLFKDKRYMYDAYDHPYEDYQEFMRKYTYLSLSNRYEEASHLFKDLALFIPNLPLKSLNVMLAVTARNLYHDLRFSDAKELLLLMHMEEEDIILNMIQKKWLLKISLKLKQALLFEKIYQEYIELLVNEQYFDEIPKIELERKILFQEINKINYKAIDMQQPEILKTSVRGMYRQGLYEQIIAYTKNHLDDPICLIYHLRSLEKQSDKKQLINKLKEVMLFKITDRTAELVIRHLRFKYLSHKEDQLQYLRNEVLGFKHMTDEIDILYYFMMDAFEIFKKYHYYKESAEIISKYLPMIKQLKNS